MRFERFFKDYICEEINKSFKQEEIPKEERENVYFKIPEREIEGNPAFEANVASTDWNSVDKLSIIANNETVVLYDKNNDIDLSADDTVIYLLGETPLYGRLKNQDSIVEIGSVVPSFTVSKEKIVTFSYYYRFWDSTNVANISVPEITIVFESVKYNTTVEAKKEFDIIATCDNVFKVHEILDRYENGVLFLIQGGNVVKSSIPNYDLNTMPIVVNIVTFLDLKDSVLETLTEVSARLNSVLQTVKIDGKAVKFRATYSTPFVVGESFEIKHGKGTAKVANFQWVINVSYGKDAYIDTPSLSLIVGEKEYKVTYLMRFEYAYAPTYDSYIRLGGDGTASYSKISTSRSYVLQIADTDDIEDEFQSFLKSVRMGGEFTTPLTLNWGAKNIIIKTVSLSGGIEQNSGAIMLTLGV